MGERSGKILDTRRTRSDMNTNRSIGQDEGKLFKCDNRWGPSLRLNNTYGSKNETKWQEGYSSAWVTARI